MTLRIGAATALLLVPRVAAACPACLSSAYGDRTFNWAFVGLILMPFLLAASIGGVLFYKYRSARDRQPQPADPLRLTQPHPGSPRVGGPEPADPLRLTRPPLEETT